MHTTGWRKQVEFCFTKVNGSVKSIMVGLSAIFYFFRILF